jgi:hypothetical protein
MELIAKISKGTLMDQIYIPKNRAGLETGSYVIIRPAILGQEQETKPNFYNIKNIEPIKVEIARRIFGIISSIFDCENIIIVGSFLDKGFNFNDLDIVIINESKINIKSLELTVKSKLGFNSHIICLSNKELLAGLRTDPLYQAMLSRFVSKQRLIFKIKDMPDYKILDLHLIKSQSLIDNFDILTGKEKYSLTRNLIAIKLFLENKKVTNEMIDSEIMRLFKLKTINELKDNIINKLEFLRRFKEIYKKTFNKIMEGIKNESKPQ